MVAGVIALVIVRDLGVEPGIIDIFPLGVETVVIGVTTK